MALVELLGEVLFKKCTDPSTLCKLNVSYLLIYYEWVPDVQFHIDNNTPVQLAVTSNTLEPGKWISKFPNMIPGSTNEAQASSLFGYY